MAEKTTVCGVDISDCPKNMLNGPCGGVDNGMCEVSGPCVWLKVYSKLKSAGELGEFTKVRMPR